MQRITRLSRPIARRIGRLVFRVTAAGVELRGKHKKKWRSVTWAQIAGLTTGQEPLLKAVEEAVGREVLARIGAVEKKETDSEKGEKRT